MRYLLGALFLASCTMFTPLATDKPAIDSSITDSSIPDTQQEISRDLAEPPRAKPKPTSPVSEISSCSALDAGDLKETIKAKLDCITENTP